ncbi:uncharacterized protein IWZ02DRAFT_455643 [Phyllosticta citriasiana]|uniref:uncharacterized protein n=1 Tax=Phyllosticta citriasiana TaxID=595635 RepID=UPI0030FD23B7
MAPIPHPISNSEAINIAGVVMIFVGVVLATAFSLTSLRLQKQIARSHCGLVISATPEAVVISCAAIVLISPLNGSTNRRYGWRYVG